MDLPRDRAPWLKACGELDVGEDHPLISTVEPVTAHKRFKKGGTVG